MNRWTAVWAVVVCLLGQVLLVQAVGPDPTGIDPAVEKIVAGVSETRLMQRVAALQAFGTRHTLSSAGATDRGVGAARQWILDEMRRSSPRLQVAFDTYVVPPQGRISSETDVRNVVAILPGRSPRRVYVTGHYDSLARAPQPPSGGGAAGPPDHPAPGANDDATGTALVMELAQLLAESRLDFDATLVFVALVGEEQGLVGATLHAQKAAAEKLPVDAVLNVDMVGNIEGGSGLVDSTSVRVFSEGPEDSPSRQVARFIQRQAARYVPAQRVRLIARHDRFGRGGDHSAFNQHGYAGVRFTESQENYGRQHTASDTVEHVSAGYFARNVRVVAAAAATMALAPAAPRVTDAQGRMLIGRGQSGYDAELKWQASPGAVGYRVFWREAWTPDWQHETTVGSATTVVLPSVSIDDYVFGVAAIGAGGRESLVSAYVNPPRAPSEVKLKP